jgi:hypothetical protein
MAEFVYLLCALVSVFCAVLLVRSYRSGRDKLLMWSSLCFIGLAINNVLLFADFYVVPSVDLSPLRTATAVIAMLVMTFGLVWESR